MTPLSELHAAARAQGLPHYRRLSREELETALANGDDAAPLEPSPTPVRLERDGPLALIVLDDPATRNAIGSLAMDCLDTILTELEGDDDVRLVAVTGAGRVFCSGAAIREFDVLFGGATQLNERGTKLLDRLEDLPVPTVALVNGHAVGGGAEAALACDWRIMAADAELRFVHASIGLTPGFGGLGRLARIVGDATAFRLFATCESVAGRRAVELGLAAEVVPAAAQQARVRNLAARVADSDRRAVAAIKSALAAGTRSAEREAFLASWPNRRIPPNAQA